MEDFWAPCWPGTPFCPGELLTGFERGTLLREVPGLVGQARNILQLPCLVFIAAVGFSGLYLHV